MDMTDNARCLHQLTQGKTVVAVSGGPDSMALLDWLRRQGLPLVVAHVNYHRRDSANRDEQIVFDYCNRYQLPFYPLDASQKAQGNFQNWAREVRYRFFKEVADVTGAIQVCVAHHQDDVIETYLMQKQKGITPSYWGMKEETELYGLCVLRPFLKVTKAECERYCQQHQIMYGIDESNLTDAYTRNQLRHQLNLSCQERQQILNEIEERNQILKEQQEKLSAYVQKYQIQNYTLLTSKEKQQALRMMLKRSKKETYYQEMVRQLDAVGSFQLKDDLLEIVQENLIWAKDYQKPYQFTFDSLPLQQDYGYFKVVSFQEGTSFDCCTVREDDFPITIRSFQEGDKIQMRYGTKSVHRWFIDRKIPRFLRKQTPVVENCRKEIIFVSGIGCNATHYTSKPNLIVVK